MTRMGRPERARMATNRSACPACGALCLHDNCCECGEPIDKVLVLELEVCPRCGKNWETHACRFCGCCGKFWKDCPHPSGPTDDFAEVCRRLP